MAHDARPFTKANDAEWFFKEASKTLGWEDLTGDVIMDIGCGTGNSSAAFLELFPMVEKIIAIEYFKSNIEVARENHPHEKLEFVVADIQNGMTLLRWRGKISKAISIYCLNTLRELKDPPSWEVDCALVFRHLKELLRPDGEAALLIKLYGSYDTFLDEVTRNEEFAPYLLRYIDGFPPGRIQMTSANDYKVAAKMVGFEVVEWKKTERVYYYETEGEFKDALMHSIPFRRGMDQSTEDKFRDFLLESVLESNPKSEDGKFCIRNEVLFLLLRMPKPKKESEKSKCSDS